jgi:hypothetical protein
LLRGDRSNLPHSGARSKHCFLGTNHNRSRSTRELHLH